MGCPHSTFTPKTAPFPSTISTPISYTHPSTDFTHHPKRHPDPISPFATVHLAVRQTDTQTDRWARRQVCTETRLCSDIATRLISVYGSYIRTYEFTVDEMEPGASSPPLKWKSPWIGHWQVVSASCETILFSSGNSSQSVSDRGLLMRESKPSRPDKTDPSVSCSAVEGLRAVDESILIPAPRIHKLAGPHIVTASCITAV